MIHLGDITKIHGDTAPIVDCIIGGSPCQDLSTAGKRAGLAGERSGLYMEQIRVTREMRESDRANGRTGEFIRPRYMVWENVPGAFSSNGGRDFQSVLTETVRVVEPKAPPVPVPEKGWPTSGCLVGDGWSVAWRVLDAQFWGVPQRRRRIVLVADFGGQSAPEILFIRKGVPGHSEPGGETREGLAGGTESNTSFAVRIRGGCDGGGMGALVQKELSGTFGCNNDQTVFCLNDQGGSVMGVTENVSGTLRAQEHGHQPTILDMAHPCDVIRECDDTVPTLSARMGTGGNNVPLVAYGIENGQVNEAAAPAFEKAKTLNTMHDAQAVFCPDVAHALKAKANLDFREDSETYQVQSGKVRRLTPLECERLQGYPDGWTDIGEWVDGKGKKRQTTDSARYKALGNSIALPPWKWVLKRICAQYERDATMASLFDGIGGFPLLWEQLNGKGSCLWASEIEEFPMSVTRKHFG